MADVLGHSPTAASQDPLSNAVRQTKLEGNSGDQAGRTQLAWPFAERPVTPKGVSHGTCCPTVLNPTLASSDRQILPNASPHWPDARLGPPGNVLNSTSPRASQLYRIHDLIGPFYRPNGRIGTIGVKVLRKLPQRNTRRGTIFAETPKFWVLSRLASRVNPWAGRRRGPPSSALLRTWLGSITVSGTL